MMRERQQSNFNDTGSRLVGARLVQAAPSAALLRNHGDPRPAALLDWCRLCAESGFAADDAPGAGRPPHSMDCPPT